MKLGTITSILSTLEQIGINGKDAKVVVNLKDGTTCPIEEITSSTTEADSSAEYPKKVTVITLHVSD